jgi:hypothetical protein
MKIEKWKGGRFHGLYQDNGELIAVIVYKKGAVNVKRLLEVIEIKQEQVKGSSPS